MTEFQDFLKRILQITDLGWLEDKLTFIIVTITTFISFIGVLHTIFKYIKEQKTLRETYASIPYYSENEIKNAVKNYVETNCQSVSSTISNEPNQTFAFVPKEKILPFFIDKAFKNSSGDFKYFIILADSGMGKTTFLINLVLTFNKKNRKLINYFSWTKNQMLLIPLADKDALDIISDKDINEKRKTILLLDAFDEDTNAVINYRKRMDEILFAVKDYKEVVITCRTQFFQSEEDEPNSTGLFKYGGAKGKHTFKKIYLSPFDDKEIKVYLRKKYPIWKILSRELALIIVKKSPNLMVRPMLLSYIDDFLTHKNNRPKYYININLNPFAYVFKIKKIYFRAIKYFEISFSYTYQIYELLIEKWIEREATRSDNEITFKKELYKFSKEIALNMYDNRIMRNGFYIPATEIDEFAAKNNITLSNFEMRSKSLLNRDSVERYKFSHRSILEYFVALEAITNNRFKEMLVLDGMENVPLFLSEMALDKHLNQFLSAYPNFSILCLTDFGVIHEIYSNNPPTLFLLKSTNYIFFEDSFLENSDIINVIFSFPYLNIFSKDSPKLRYQEETFKKLKLKEMKLVNELQNQQVMSSIEKQVFEGNLKNIQNELMIIETNLNNFISFELKLLQLLNSTDSRINDI